MSIPKIIPTDSKDAAWELSRKLQIEWAERNGMPAGASDILLGIYENIISGEYGLFATSEWWNEVPNHYKERHQVATPLWVNERFVNGEPFIAFGLGEHGFSLINPQENRKTLEASLSHALIKDVRAKSRAYTFEVYERASRIITDIKNTPEHARKLLESLKGDEFEELIAELLKTYGCDVMLTKKSGDGGKDLIAVIPGKNKPIVAMIECKRRKDSHTLGPIEPRALLGQFYYNNEIGMGVDCAMLVTNASKAGKSALILDQSLSNFSIKMGDDVLKWISHYGKIKNGLWLPNPIDELLL